MISNREVSNNVNLSFYRILACAPSGGALGLNKRESVEEMRDELGFVYLL